MIIIYIIIAVFVVGENYFLDNSYIAYAISCVTSWTCGGNISFVESWRYPFLSVEPSTAAIVISSTLLPFTLARVILVKNIRNYIFFIFVMMSIEIDNNFY